TNAHLWDVSAVGALERVAGRLRARGARVELIGLNAASATMVSRLSPEISGPPEPLID
ncbi:MAG: sodium-independent anion transporter, partial [Methylobacterium sp.]|nr:sodium-independent anion transporter [Methylobacterium sp.]